MHGAQVLAHDIARIQLHAGHPAYNVFCALLCAGLNGVSLVMAFISPHF
jgi:hypothetical protein